MQASADTWSQLPAKQQAMFQPRGDVPVKGKGVMQTFVLNPEALAAESASACP